VGSNLCEVLPYPREGVGSWLMGTLGPSPAPISHRTSRRRQGPADLPGQGHSPFSEALFQESFMEGARSPHLPDTQRVEILLGDLPTPGTLRKSERRQEGSLLTGDDPEDTVGLAWSM